MPRGGPGPPAVLQWPEGQPRLRGALGMASPAPQARPRCFLSGGSCLLGCGPWSQAGAAWAGRGSEVWCQPCASPWSGPGLRAALLSSCLGLS